MVVRNQESVDPCFELGRKSICFDRWPDEMFLMATRNWPNIIINDTMYETQTSFFSGNMSDLDHQMVSWFLASLDVDGFTAWLSLVGTKFARDELTPEWLAEQSVNHDLFHRFQVVIGGITTFPASCPGEQDERSLHLAFLLNSKAESQSSDGEVAALAN